MTQQEYSNLTIPASTQALKEAESLSAAILEDIELSQAPLSVVVLKALRLARLLNDFEVMQIFQWESAGYPTGESGVSPAVWAGGRTAGRLYYHTDTASRQQNLRMYVESIEKLQHDLEMGQASLQAAQDPNVSITSANQYQMVSLPHGNSSERIIIRNQISQSSDRLASRRTFIHHYAIRKHYELKFSGVVDDIFGRVRAFVDESISLTVPDAVKKFTAAYDNLKSDNPEDWSNAVHSCRRVLQDLADAVFPAQQQPHIRTKNGKEIEVKLGQDKYINRLMAFIEDSSNSDRFTEIVGSNLGYIGDRLNAVFHAAQKGSHSNVSKEEADRYVIYTYLIVGDILSLSTLVSQRTQSSTKHTISAEGEQ